jgi:hypothetical protein
VARPNIYPGCHLCATDRRRSGGATEVLVRQLTISPPAVNRHFRQITGAALVSSNMETEQRDLNVKESIKSFRGGLKCKYGSLDPLRRVLLERADCRHAKRKCPEGRNAGVLGLIVERPACSRCVKAKVECEVG